MRAVDLVKPLVVFVAVVAVVLAGTAVVGLSVGGSESTPDGQNVDGQSPSDWQPENVNVDSAAEDGDIQVDAGAEEKRILVDTRHSNSFERTDLEPLTTALFESGHEVRFQGSSDSGFGGGGYNETLQEFDAVLVIAPSSDFSDTDVAGLEAYVRGGGRVVVLNEPSQNVLASSGLFGASATTKQYSGNKLTEEFGMRIDEGVLYNIDDAQNDNNFKSVYAAASGAGPLVSGVDRVTLDTAGRLAMTGESDANPFLTSTEGTTLLETRRTGDYTVAARNGNLVLVADSSFVQTSELYDADNPQFVSNLLEFLVSGDKPDEVPREADDEDDNGFGDDDETPEPPEETPEEPPGTPEEPPTETPTPPA